jgi:hypothetical protein
MSTLLQVELEKPVAKRRFRRPAVLGMVALGCGILSLSGGVIQALWGPFTPYPSFTEQLVENAATVSETIVSTFTGQVHIKESPAAVVDVDLMIKRVVVLLSLAGILSAILAYVRREDSRVVGSALLISGSVFALHYLFFPLVVIAVVGVVVLITVAF